MSKFSISFRNTLGASLGTALEFYDFTLYGIFAVLLAPLFFPNDELSAMLTLVVYALGSFFRPLGGLVFGYIADTQGRKKALMISIFIMSLSTFSIGFLPTYAEIGAVSIFLLVILRCFQGFSAGGEFNNTTIYALESNMNYPGLYSGIVVASATIGTLIAMTLASLILKINHVDAWRIPFFIGGGIGLFGYYYRKFLTESPSFAKKQNSHIFDDLKIILKEHRISLLKTTLIGGFASVLGLTVFNYVNIYLSSIVGLDSSYSALLSIVSIGGFIIFTPIFGLLADYVKPERIMLISAIVAFCLAHTIYSFLSSGVISNIILAQILLTFLSSSFSGSVHLFLIKLFPVQLRCLAVSFGFTLGIALFGGTTPLISNILIKYTHNNLSPSLYIMLSSTFVIWILTLNLSKKNTNNILSSQQEREEISINARS